MADEDPKVRVQRPDGRYSSIPRSSLQGAMARGYKLAPSAEFMQGQKEQQEPKTTAPTKHFWEDPLGPPQNDIESDALRRGTESTVKAITGIPGALYHAASDPESAEESQKFGKGFESKIGPVGRLIDRSAVQPTMNALDWYKKAIQGKIPDPVGQALSVGPEAVGTGAGTVLGGRAADTVASKVRTPSVKDPYAPGGLIGSMTRGKSLLDRVDAAAQDIPVNYKPAYEWAQKAMELGKHGFTVPKPISDFVQWVESRQRSGADVLGGGKFMDRGADLNPLPYQVSRNFEQALGAKIPWDADPGGRMSGYMKKMRESLGQETASALKPHGLDVPYLKGKAEISKAYGAKGKIRPVGYIGGKIAGYGTGSVTGHPLMMGYAGGKLGQGAAESMADSLVNARGNK